MVVVAQINLIVADIEVSRAFYARLGVEFRSRNRHGEGVAEAWVATNTGVTMVIHSTAFAAWWDETAPRPVAGGPQIDLELGSARQLDDLVAEPDGVGADVIKVPTDMPWGQRFAIVRDPDGHRVGLKAPIEHERPASGWRGPTVSDDDRAARR
ncbi:VOC family protein [Georgenia sp. Z1491]|uniref:VOC family protein n=1 Tax=Georgenia sp. Z1491 TaxID=3416707 RepID=UPI003CF943F5